MFEDLFSYPAVLRRHREGPLAQERATYLASIASRGLASETVLRKAREVLCIAQKMEKWPNNHGFTAEEIDTIASSWAATQVEQGKARAMRWPREHFRQVALEFLASVGRLVPRPVPPKIRDEDRLEDFIMHQRQERGSSIATCGNWRWQIRKFLQHLDQSGCLLESVTAEHVDTYFQIVSQRWSRVSLRSTAIALRAWFRHCERQTWIRKGLADAILMPRVYRSEAIPIGPSWDQVARIIADADGNEPLQLRDHAILSLFAIYGLRSGEVRRLQIHDVDWRNEQIRVIRSKSARQDTLPLEPSVGNAIARYLRKGRPKNDNPILFLTARAPFQPLSPGALHGIVSRRQCRVAGPKTGRGPHGLRHACARHLLEAGLSFKEVGDHLGHRSPDATRIYAKVTLTQLRAVALEDLGGLV